MKKNLFLTLLLVLAFGYAKAQGYQPVQIPLPANLPQERPRPHLVGSDVDAMKHHIAPYFEQVQKQPDWLLSRLMMYWKSHATQVYINGGVYSHADGKASMPTVRFGSTRGISSVYGRPRNIADIVPYMDDTKGVYFPNNSKPDRAMEWVEQANVSGGSIESVNSEILGYGREGAYIYYKTGDVRYAKFAYDILDTYLTGMYYRTEPIDIGHGHAQTLVGMSTFEVIQEHFLKNLAEYYDYLYGYIKANHPKKIAVYEDTFRKWIDLTIKHGVPHNNWDLHQANIILGVAIVLEDNNRYADGKGREYYINQVLNHSTPRQWTIGKLMNYGYDSQTGIWNECPGYAISVAEAFMNFIVNYDNTFGTNLLTYMPVMYKAVDVLPQYLFPNGLITAFGDTSYDRLNTRAIDRMIELAKKYGKHDDEKHYTHLRNNQMDYVTPVFYAPNVSWIVQRNMPKDALHGLMISEYASLGNHAHSNGLAMELYGKGYVLGVDPGRGSSYFEKPYLEYYSQFPAHNTVMVDGISKYPEMLSNHAFRLLGCYPQSGQREGYYPDISFSDVFFLEPESQSDQTRLMSIIRTGLTTGYYVDIFRSRKQQGGEAWHDYYYHNIGQTLTIANEQGQPLLLHPGEEMAFAGGHLFALDYMWDKQSARTDGNYRATWKMAMPDGNHVYMNLWMKGYADREVFSIKSPPCKAFRNIQDFPYPIDTTPLLTLAARQHGQAWTRPFVSIFEPTTEQEKQSIRNIEPFEAQGAADDFVGLIVTHHSGRKDFIFSSARDETVTYNGFTVKARYAVVSQIGNNCVMFMGEGTLLKAHDKTLSAPTPQNKILEFSF